MQDTEKMLKAMALSLKETSAFLVYVRQTVQNMNRDIPPAFDGHISGAHERAVTVNGNFDAITNALEALRDSTQRLADEERALTLLAESVQQVDTKDALLRVTIAQNAVQEARAALSDYTVYAPVSGKLTELDAKVGKAVVMGEILATIASPQNIARVALSEADAFKVRSGHRAVVLLDAIEAFVLEGTILKVDKSASAGDGVVRVYVSIGFAEGDPRVHPA